MIVEDWLRSKSIRERNTMTKWALRARIIITCTYLILVIEFTIFFGVFIFGKSIRLAPNITGSGRPLLLPTYYIYDVTKRPQYELTIISQGISLITVATVYTGIDNFLGLLVFHICGQLDIMKNNLKYNHENFRDILRSSVMHHIRLLRYAYIIIYIIIYNIYVT